MLSANSIATPPPHLALGSHYAAQQQQQPAAAAQHKAAARASAADASALDQPAVYAGDTMAAALAAVPGANSGSMQTIMAGGYSDGNNNRLAAPRPVAAQQLGPPSWMVTALEQLLGLGAAAGAASYQHKIINDVFFTPEERPQAPQLTPVSEPDDEQRPPSDALEGFDSSSPADLAMLWAAEPRLGWGSDEIETASRHASPTPTITFDDCDDNDGLLAGAKFLLPSTLSAHVAAQAKSPYAW
ncbi:hypothetical protein GGI00_004867 [Coemansia sp. RSA 2681]|nr:hypothetical protein GGI00_004867 [Coemansia sp. RSA 2681]